jgi:hypothetical protein
VYRLIFIFWGIAVFSVLILILWVLWDKGYESPRVRAGKEGEKEATEIIKRVLRENDILLTNVRIQYKEKETELDNVIINNRGVFIIEVKNYSGVLIGGENDYEWTKYKVSRGGNTYEKQVRNPIKQVKRQVYILSRFLKYYGINVWIDGYVLLLNRNGPVDSSLILESYEQINEAIHKRQQKEMNKKTVLAIKELLM